MTLRFTGLGQWERKYCWAMLEVMACVRQLLKVGCQSLARTTAALCTINKKICIRTFTLREERGICIIKCGMLKKQLK